MVTLPDGYSGKVLDIFNTNDGVVFKIKRPDTGEELYFDERKVTLKKRNIRNLLSDLLGMKL